MNFKRTACCGNCPFRLAPDFFMSYERRKDIAQAILERDHTFPCHKTVDYDSWDSGDDGEPMERPHNPNESHCAGALMTLIASGEVYRNFPLRFAVITRLADPDKLSKRVPTYASMAHWIGAGLAADDVDMLTTRNGTGLWAYLLDEEFQEVNQATWDRLAKEGAYVEED